MQNYGNGESTRRLILDTARELFLTKGYAEVKMSDVCQLAHIDRGTLYYHFTDKNTLRYAVLIDIIQFFQNFVEPYCKDPKLRGQVAIYCFIDWLFSYPSAVRFYAEAFKDNPLYLSGTPAAEFYDYCCDIMYSPFFKPESIAPMAYGSVYGFLGGMMTLLKDDPSHYSIDEIFRHTLLSGVKTWNHSEGQAAAMWNAVKQEVANLPPNYLETIKEI